MKAAVIGTGSIGLVYIKNLKAEGLDVTGFDRAAKRTHFAVPPILSSPSDHLR